MEGDGGLGGDADNSGDDPDRILNLSPKDFEAFKRILDAPPDPNDKLVELLRGYTVVSQGWK